MAQDSETRLSIERARIDGEDIVARARRHACIMYHRSPLDGYYREVGRTLEQLADEIEKLRGK